MPRKKKSKAPGSLSRREREILESLYGLKSATAAEIREALQDPPTYTAVRTHLTNLERKGCVSFRSDGTRYIYEPTLPREEMGQKVIGDAMKTFFDNRIELVVSTLLDQGEAKVSEEQLDRLAAIIATARKAGL
jgi:predicted transcriptional regulator